MNRSVNGIINIGLFECYMQRGNFTFIQATRKTLVRKLHSYLESFRATFYKHCTSETEINIVGNNIDDTGWERINGLEKDSKLLDFNKNILDIINVWLLKLNGQPQTKMEARVDEEICKVLKANVFKFVTNIQEDVLREKKFNENKECVKKCSDGPKIFNFTEHEISPEIIKQLEKGLGYVPHTKERNEAISQRIETEIKQVAIRYFYKINGFMPPMGISKMTMGQFIKQLLIFSPASSKENEFFYRINENLENVLKSLIIGETNDESLDNLDVLNNLPNDIIVTSADKNIGIALVPIQWFIDEYYRQQEKGAFESIDLDEKQCIDKLDLCISSFRSSCNNEQKLLIKNVWPRTRGVKKIGILKLTPKVQG